MKRNHSTKTKKTKSLNISERERSIERTRKMKKAMRDILLVMMTMMTIQVCEYMSCISYGIESTWCCLMVWIRIFCVPKDFF